MAETARSEAASLVYVIGVRGRSVVKLGTTTKIRKRLQALQIGSPELLEVLWSCPGSRASEAALHQHFAHLRVRGEWFDFGDQSPVEAVRAAVEAGIVDEAHVSTGPVAPSDGRYASPVSRGTGRPREYSQEIGVVGGTGGRRLRWSCSWKWRNGRSELCARGEAASPEEAEHLVTEHVAERHGQGVAR